MNSTRRSFLLTTWLAFLAIILGKFKDLIPQEEPDLQYFMGIDMGMDPDKTTVSIYRVEYRGSNYSDFSDPTPWYDSSRPLQSGDGRWVQTRYVHYPPQYDAKPRHLQVD